MIARRQFLTKAGSILGLPFFLAGLDGTTAEIPRTEEEEPSFVTFSSSCIDLGRYDARSRQLTVRFVDPKKLRGRFYRYSNVPPETWTKLLRLNEAGGVGSYLNETIVKNPKTFPFQELRIKDLKTTTAKKKAENSK